MEKSETSKEEFGILEWLKTLQYLFASGFFSGIVWTYPDLDKLLHPIFYYATFPLPGIGFSFVFYFILKRLPNSRFLFVSFCVLTNLLFLLSVFLFAISNHLIGSRFYEVDSDFLPRNSAFLDFFRFFLILALSSFTQIKIIEYATHIKLKFHYILFIALISGLLAVSVFFETAEWPRGILDFLRLKKEEDSRFYDSNVLSIRLACFVWTLIHGCIAVLLIWAGDDDSESEPLLVNPDS